jgi:glycosyltransferase involved in cell wall biosynthesis
MGASAPDLRKPAITLKPLPVRILLASSSSGSRGGGELYLVYLGRALAQRGHQITLWASTHPRMDELANTFSSFGEVLRSSYRNTYDRPTRSIGSYLNYRGSRRIAREWRAAGVDFIHLNKQNLEDGLDLLRAATQSRVPSLCTIHLTQSAHYLRAVAAWARDAVARRALRDYHGMLVTVLASRRTDLLGFLGASPRVRTIANGVPLFDLALRPRLHATKRAELGIGEKELLFLAVGRMVPQKRPLVFLEQAAKVLREIPTARFLWVGDGQLTPQWDEWVARQGLGGRIQRLPWQMDVLPLLFAADVFLHTAEFEGLPLAILEALSAALPCAILPNLLAEMPFLNADNSLTVDDSGRWLKVVNDPAERERLGRNGRNLAEAEFSYGQMAQHYETLYAVAKKNTP